MNPDIKGGPAPAGAELDIKASTAPEIGALSGSEQTQADFIEQVTAPVQAEPAIQHLASVDVIPARAQLEQDVAAADPTIAGETGIFSDADLKQHLDVTKGQNGTQSAEPATSQQPEAAIQDQSDQIADLPDADRTPADWTDQELTDTIANTEKRLNGYKGAGGTAVKLDANGQSDVITDTENELNKLKAIQASRLGENSAQSSSLTEEDQTAATEAQIDPQAEADDTQSHERSAYLQRQDQLTKLGEKKVADMTSEERATFDKLQGEQAKEDAAYKELKDKKPEDMTDEDKKKLEQMEKDRTETMTPEQKLQQEISDLQKKITEGDGDLQEADMQKLIELSAQSPEKMLNQFNKEFKQKIVESVLEKMSKSAEMSWYAKETLDKIKEFVVGLYAAETFEKQAKALEAQVMEQKIKAQEAEKEFDQARKSADAKKITESGKLFGQESAKLNMLFNRANQLEIQATTATANQDQRFAEVSYRLGLSTGWKFMGRMISAHTRGIFGRIKANAGIYVRGGSLPSTA